MNHLDYLTLTKLTELFSEIDIRFPPRTMLVFYEIARNPEGITVSQIQQRLGLPQATASRNCRALTKRKTPTAAGYDLCEVILLDDDHRSKSYRLNDKGRALIAKIESTLNKRSG